MRVLTVNTWEKEIEARYCERWGGSGSLGTHAGDVALCSEQKFNIDIEDIALYDYSC